MRRGRLLRLGLPLLLCALVAGAQSVGIDPQQNTLTFDLAGGSFTRAVNIFLLVPP